MTDFLHLIIPDSAFILLSGNPATYTFNTHIAKHNFCATCGIKSYYTPRSNPNGVSVNFHCVDPSTFTQVDYENFDGQNWEDNADSLEYLSE